jgi:hypothetical protein
MGYKPFFIHRIHVNLGTYFAKKDFIPPLRKRYVSASGAET